MVSRGVGKTSAPKHFVMFSIFERYLGPRGCLVSDLNLSGWFWEFLKFIRFPHGVKNFVDLKNKIKRDLSVLKKVHIQINFRETYLAKIWKTTWNDPLSEFCWKLRSEDYMYPFIFSFNLGGIGHVKTWKQTNLNFSLFSFVVKSTLWKCDSERRILDFSEKINISDITTFPYRSSPPKKFGYFQLGIWTKSRSERRLQRAFWKSGFYLP